MTQADSTAAIHRLASRSDRLQRRRFELLPLRGPDAAFTDVQGRGWGSGPTTSPKELEDLISSIATSGLLQPVLVEELPDDGGRRIVSGHRRLLAMRWGSVHVPDNPHFDQLPAVVVDGPLTDEEQRVWQLIENLARTDLRPGELAAALLYERCAVLATKLDEHGVAIPEHCLALDDPAARFAALDRVRVGADLHGIGAPWEEVIRRLGLQLSAAKAKKLVMAFRALPAELSSDMDKHAVTLASRLEFLKLHRGRQEAAEDIWAAVRQRERPQLLTRAVLEAENHPQATADELVDVAEAVHEAANQARGASMTPDGGGRETNQWVPGPLVDAARLAVDRLLAELRQGGVLHVYDSGSLRLKLRELDARLDDAIPDRGWLRSKSAETDDRRMPAG